MNAGDKLTRAQKAAAILVAMGKPSAGRLLKFFKQEELKTLIEAARTLKTISQADLDRMVGEFENEFTEGAGLLDSGDSMDTLLSETLTPEEVSAIMDETQKPREDAGPPPIWPQLEQLPPERLAGLIEHEHPQIVAMILANLKQESAAAALVVLPKTLRTEVVKRMMSMGEVPDGARKMVENQMRTRLEARTSTRDASAGQARVANLLNQLDKDKLDEVMADMEASGASGLDGLRARLFAFEDVLLLGEKARVKLLDGLATDLVTLALRGAGAEITEAILSALGARSRRMIEAELADETAVRAEDVSRARKTIASTAIRLSSEGAITLPSVEKQAA